VQRYFDAFKKDLMSSTLLSLAEFTCDLFLYLVASDSTVGMVLVK
jgi:hypothetical protein